MTWWLTRKYLFFTEAYWICFSVCLQMEQTVIVYVFSCELWKWMRKWGGFTVWHHNDEMLRGMQGDSDYGKQHDYPQHYGRLTNCSHFSTLCSISLIFPVNLPKFKFKSTSRTTSLVWGWVVHIVLHSSVSPLLSLSAQYIYIFLFNASFHSVLCHIIPHHFYPRPKGNLISRMLF